MVDRSRQSVRERSLRRYPEICIYGSERILVDWAHRVAVLSPAQTHFPGRGLDKAFFARVGSSE